MTAASSNENPAQSAHSQAEAQPDTHREALPQSDTHNAGANPDEKAQKPAPVPWLGILSVLLGLSISVFFGQFLSSGLPDLRGALHLSVDQGAWMGAAFNGGQMFMGPLSVYLGGLAGPRRILLIASAVVCVATALIPFTSSYAVLIMLLGIVGLSAGCFYPLTLTFILRGVPPPLILPGIACYTIDVIGALHVSTAWQAWYLQHLSWRWLFWHFSIAAPVVFVLVFFGMPDQPKPPSKGPKPEASWRGFVYASCGLSAIYVALTQGERLNWFHSGTITGLFAAGAFLLLASVIRHFVQPLPLIDFRLIGRYNIIAMTAGLVIMRFCLQASVTIVPSFLSDVQQYRPEQTAPVLAIVALPMALFGTLSALSMRFIHPRVILAGGFSLVAVGCLLDHALTSVWAAQNFLRTELFLGTGLALTIVGLVGCIVVSAINGDAMANPVRALTVAAWFHMVRLMGGEVGAIVLGRILDVREKFHSNMLGQSVSLSRPQVARELLTVIQGFASKSPTLGTAAGRSVALLDARIMRQAYTLASMDGFTAIALSLVVGLLVAAFMRQEPIGFAQLTSAKKESD